MKNILLFLSLLASAIAFGHSAVTASTAAKKTTPSTVPQELITDDSTYWMISTVSGVNYVNTTPGRITTPIKMAEA